MIQGVQMSSYDLDLKPFPTCSMRLQKSNRIFNVVRDRNDAEQCTNTIYVHGLVRKMKRVERTDAALLNYTWIRRNQIKCARYCWGMNKWCIIDTASYVMHSCSQSSLRIYDAGQGIWGIQCHRSNDPLLMLYVNTHSWFHQASMQITVAATYKKGFFLHSWSWIKSFKWL